MCVVAAADVDGTTGLRVGVRLGCHAEDGLDLAVFAAAFDAFVGVLVEVGKVLPHLAVFGRGGIAALD